MKKMSIWNKTQIIVKVFVSVLLIKIMFDIVDFDSTLILLKKMNLIFFLMALVVTAIGIFITNLRWQVILNHLEVSIKFFMLLKYLWIGFFFNQTLPSSIGGDAFRAYYLWKREHLSIGLSSMGVVLDRYIGLVSLVMLIMISTPLSFDLINDQFVKSMLEVVLYCSLFIIISSVLFGLFVTNLLRWKLIKGLSSFSNNARRIIFSFKGLYSIVLSIIIQIIFVFAVLLLAHGLNLDISLIEMLLIVPITNLLTAIPISIAGWGVREGIFIVGLGYVNISSDAALALSILYGLLMLIVSVPGLVVWLVQKYKVH
ncbi:flippase-like domain-containing protein [Candidatus Thioglobus sp.]|nr:flippase-like domain-containing protein [Candidatus Thioglobus sp.]